MERSGGDAAVAQALLLAAREAGFSTARVGVAGTCIAAAVATRERGSAWRVVSPGRDMSFLRRRSLAVLPMPEDLRESLEVLGLRTCGELADLAAPDVELRWGREGIETWRLARADDPRWPFRPSPPDRASAQVEFEVPLETLEPLQFALAGLIDAVVAQMAARQRIPEALRLVLLLEGVPEKAERIQPARPTADPRLLLRLVREALTRVGPLPAPVIGVQLEGVDEGVARADQLDAFAVAAPDPAAVQMVLLPVLARWGPEALCRAVHRGAHLPHARAAWESTPLPAIGRRGAARQGRAGESRLRRPELTLCLRRLQVSAPLRVSEDAQGKPEMIEIVDCGLHAYTPETTASHRVHAEGPERLSGEWNGGWEAREYWRVEFPSGWLALVYRDARSSEWFLEGWFD
jgi:protein ImuB